MQKVNKNLILSLIKDDLIHNKLLVGLSSLGLQPELYALELSNTIFTLLEIKENEQGKKQFEEYLKLLKKIETVDLKKSDDRMDVLAREIYRRLVGVRRITNPQKF
jgi:hypothetical protein